MTWTNFEKSLEERNRQIAASTCIDDAADFRQRSARIWTHMGHCYKEIENWNRAAVYFDAAIGSGKESDFLMSAYQGLGEVYFHKGEFDRELELFTKAEDLLEGMPKDIVADSHRYRIAKLKIETFLKKNDAESARQLMPTLKRLAEGSEKKTRECKKLEKRVLV